MIENLIRVCYVFRQEEAGKLSQIEQSLYRSGILQKQIRYTEEGIYETNYDDKGNIIEEKNPITQIVTTYEYHYQDGFLAYSYAIQQGVPISRKRYEYDPYGRMSKVYFQERITPHEDDNYYIDAQDNNLYHTNEVRSFIYNAKGDLVKTLGSNLTILYDKETGCQKSMRSIQLGETDFILAVQLFNAKKELIRTWDINENEEEYNVVEYQYKYDKFGNWIERGVAIDEASLWSRCPESTIDQKGNFHLVMVSNFHKVDTRKWIREIYYEDSGDSIPF